MRTTTTRIDHARRATDGWPAFLALLVATLAASACGAGPAPKPQATPTAASGAVLDRLPDTIDPDRTYLFYLHGRIIEERGRRPEHPRFGVYEYDAILERLAAGGAAVVSEARPAGTEVAAYARTVADEVERLLAAGVPAQRITVAGFSKGGMIALFASSILARDDVNYVVMAGCGHWLAAAPALRPRGRILSIYDASDRSVTSCTEAFARSPHGVTSRELVLEVGGGHGVFYRPLEAWVGPLLDWVASAPGPVPR